MATPQDIAKARKLSRINQKKMKVLMEDIRKDVSRLTSNSKDLDEWLTKLSPYAVQNAFTVGVKAPEVAEIIAEIVKGVNYGGLPKGAHMELVKGVISENTMHYVTRMGDDMKTELRKIAVNGYNDRLAPKDLAKQMSQKIDGLSRTRAQVIARTETMRANNLSNYTNARINQGAKSFIVINDLGTVCPDCEEAYQNGAVVFDISEVDEIPPRHPRCNCVPRFSTKSPEDNPGGPGLPVEEDEGEEIIE